MRIFFEGKKLDLGLQIESSNYKLIYFRERNCLSLKLWKWRNKKQNH